MQFKLGAGFILGKAMKREGILAGVLGKLFAVEVRVLLKVLLKVQLASS